MGVGVGADLSIETAPASIKIIIMRLDADKRITSTDIFRIAISNQPQEFRLATRARLR